MPADLDGDGDADVLSTASHGGTIVWYENLGGEAFSHRRLITAKVSGVGSLFATDLDGDGDVDVLSAPTGGSMIAWHENLGGGMFSHLRVISTEAFARISYYSRISMFAADLDGDGDADVLSASYDGDVEVLSASRNGGWGDDKIAWFENLGGGTFSGQRVITKDGDGASAVFAADLDGDGDADVLSASEGDDNIAWYENLVGGEDRAGEAAVAPEATVSPPVDCRDWDSDDFASLARFYGTVTPTAVVACLKAGMDPSARMSRQLTALHHVARWSQNPTVIAALLDAGADINPRDEYGYTPLHYAASFHQQPRHHRCAARSRRRHQCTTPQLWRHAAALGSCNER